MPINTKQFGRIGVLMGGYSSERAISLKSGTAIFEALKAEHCDVVALDIQDQEEQKIIDLIKKADIDIAFIALHGQLGEDGTIQSILEKLEIPYPGSGVDASRLSINKVLAQNLFKKNNIQIAPFVSLVKKNSADIDEVINQLKSFPLVVKPACEGSSIGVTLVRNKKELIKAIDVAWQYGPQVLVEKYIKGRELTVGILNQKALCVIEICAKGDFFDFAAKYQSGLTEYIFPAQIPQQTALRIQKMALDAHTALGCEDLSRVDFILSDDGTPYVLEINTIPGFTSTSLLPKAAKEAGLNFNQLCFKLVELAYGKKKKSTTIPVSR